MRWKLLGRIVGYLVLGTVAGLGILAVRTYPTERTILDRIEDIKYDLGRKPKVRRVHCGWRILFCSEIPRGDSQLNPMVDSALGEDDRMTCRWMFSAHGAGLGWDIEDRDLMTCFATRADTHLSLLVDEKGRVYDITRAWLPADLDAEYARLKARIIDQYGPDFLCPQNDDLYFTEDRAWQLQGSNLRVGKSGREALTLSWQFGRIACHTSP